jgi:Lrp/AsnC family transcriptional regulator for asnA, asnC and gidA
MPSKTARRIDATDVKILTLLQEDGRRSYTSMAEILGISEANVRQRTKRLLRRQIIAIVAVADPISLGFGIMASIGVHLTGPGRDRAAEQVAENPEISHLVLCTGSVDLQAEVVCRDREPTLAHRADREDPRGRARRDADVPAHREGERAVAHEWRR